MFKIFPGTFTSDRRKVPVKDFRWKEDASNDPNKINEWSSQYPQLKFWGVPTGSANKILVLDVDVKGGGLETVKKYHIPQTMSQTTISGGVHYIFKYPENGQIYGNRVNFDAGLDIRGEDGYIAYYGTDNLPIAEAPDWLLEQALKQAKVEVNINDAVKIAPEIVQNILSQSCENIRQAPEGESNNVLNLESYKVGQLVTSGSLDYKEAYTELFKAAKDRGKQDYEAEATINSGLKGGSNNPVVCPFGNEAPVLNFVPLEEKEFNTRWTPRFTKRNELTDFTKLRKPQLFKNWSVRDVSLLTADGGTGKTTIKLVEAICLALGESFLGFECLVESGRTLFITGEDTEEKLRAMLGAIMKQMKIMDGTPENNLKVDKILNNVLIKKDTDLTVIDKQKNGFMTVNYDALNKLTEAIEDLRPDMIVFDPIASFWGSEASLNDMSKAVTKFMSLLVDKSNACVEIINHMGKDSSSKKDLTQFAGRGGSALPSHSRVSKVLARLSPEEFQKETGGILDGNKTAMICNVNKFSDGSPLLNNPFAIIRDGYLFEKVEIIEQIEVEEKNKNDDGERILQFIKNEIAEKRYPTKLIITEHFKNQADRIPSTRTNSSLASLVYFGKIKLIENIDAEVRDRMYVLVEK